MAAEDDKPRNFDLFGDPVPDGWGKRGRPEHVPTLQSRNKVIMLLALGWSNERIAKALYITSPTLRKNYGRELKLRAEQRDRLTAAVAMRLWQGIQEGNVAAIREFNAFLERNDLMIYGQSEPPQPKDDRPPKMGKKEQAIVDALKPDTGSTLGELMAKRQGQSVN